MAIAARLDDPPGTTQPDRAPRRTLRLGAHGSLGGGDGAEVLVHNVSATGMLLECDLPLGAGDTIDVALPHAGLTRATVVWTSGRLRGCRFDAPVSSATLSAAQLRSAVAADVVPEEPPQAEAAPVTNPLSDPAARGAFSARLRRLRRDRGMTQAQVAAALGVSKPTVWAWEQGKARPEPHRIEGLATFLGVSPTQLLSGADNGALEEIVTGARQRIATLLGADPATVRIMVEL